MKKVYITPAFLSVALGTCKMMAESLPIGDPSGEPIDDPNEILTKEFKDVNLWDNEW